MVASAALAVMGVPATASPGTAATKDVSEEKLNLTFTGTAMYGYPFKSKKPGDEFGGSGKVSEKNGRVGDGKFSYYCKITAINATPNAYTNICHAALDLPKKGQIALESLVTQRAGTSGFQMAVTGGTGDYELARGHADFTETPRPAKIVVSLVHPTKTPT
ncbi:hypothetical protein NGF19_04020 [Streptomyces sp. RY43-2]|uniref:Dirigent protein n=1 Tax=Streptomyces macrolidinus TaxID=2952607 RepID=A0ABT0Z874_9ACTN|nr:hypothetical protein [Streptomyces macrolidinus]MCN9239962.1 hypothetical protein [Streptomyces macrolidinus]